jgi:hypothetical protein
MLLSSLAKDKIDAFPRLAEVVRDNTKARSLSEGTADHPEVSIQGYGLGWYRESYRGHEVGSSHCRPNRTLCLILSASAFIIAEHFLVPPRACHSTPKPELPSLSL